MNVDKYTPDYVIGQMLRQYPSLFPDRRFALVHLFATIGNGYAWVEGRLVPIGEETDEEVQARSEQFDAYLNERQEAATAGPPDPAEKAWLNQFMADLKLRFAQKAAEEAANPELRAQREAREADYQARRLARDNPEHMLRSGMTRLCPDYSRVMTMPDDVTPEWRETAIEFVAIVLAVPSDWTETQMPYDIERGIPPDRIQPAQDLLRARFPQ